MKGFYDFDGYFINPKYIRSVSYCYQKVNNWCFHVYFNSGNEYIIMNYENEQSCKKEREQLIKLVEKTI